GMVCVVGRMRDLILQLSKSSIYSTKPHSGTLSNQIVRAWYSALGLEIEDCRDLVHFPDNGKYILDINDPDFDVTYNELLERLDYLTKLDTKVFGEGDRSFGCSRG
ncbi:inovirus-type Gp2 protein, partial [Klebsiella pneumoniae]